MNMNKYKKYKDSGIEWIGDIPKHWEVKKLSYCFDIIGSGTTPKSNNSEYYNNGSYNWLQTGDLNNNKILKTSKKITDKALEDYSTLRFYPKGGLVIAMYGATIGKTGLLKIETTTNQACCVLAEPKEIISEFVFYWFNSAKKHIISMSYGGGQPNINQEMIRFLKLQLPPKLEQNAIANYLDRKTAEIDELISQKEKLLDFYEEEKKGIINQAVTKGINPDVKLKDSDIDWLGEIPEHWEEKKLRYLITILSGYSPEQCKPTRIGEIEYIKVNEIDKNCLYIKPSSFYTKKEYKTIDENSLLFPKRGAAIALNKVGIVDRPVAFDTNLMGVKLNQERINVKYIAYLIKNFSLISIADTSTIPQINNKHINPFIIPLPPLNEQSKIVSHIEKEISLIDAKVAKTQRLIELQKEYKTALISEVVTGKIKIIEEDI